MSSTLPVAIDFALPDGWYPAPPDEVGAPAAAFVALHPGADGGFTANITVSGELRTDGAPLTAIADESVNRLEQAANTVAVTGRTELGTVAAPGLTQLVKVSTAARDLVQAQVYLSMMDTGESGNHAVVQLALTATPAQLESVIDDFQAFVETVRPSG